MPRRSGRPPRGARSDRPHDPPAGATLERYEATMMLMIASRVLEAYEERDRPRPIVLDRPSPKSSDPEDGTGESA